jgi:ectoine hydroxylase-related dioxygenase (phytanoyl-CoA dioxygenase family)
MSTATITQNETYLKAWENDGFFVIPSVISAEECEKLKAESLEILKNHAREGATVYVGCAAVSGNFAHLAEHPAIVEALRLIMPDGIEFMSDKLVYKKPGKAFPTPWHIDAWYWKGTRPKLSVWIPFDDTTAENGTLTVIPGSHRHEWTVQQTKGINGEFENMLEDNDQPAADKIHTCELKRGSAVFFSDRLLHGSTASQGNRERYAIISTYHVPGDEPFDQNFSARKVLVPA